MTALTEEVAVRLGEAIRARRHGLALTLVEVANRAGLSHPFLSQLERGLARPSMRSLTAIASALETSAQALLAVAEAPVDPVVEPVSFVPSGPGVATVDSPGGTVRPLVRGERAMLPLEFCGAPTEYQEYFCHAGDEFVYVVQGCIEVEVEGEDLRLVAAGECLYYAGGLRHRWRAAGAEEVKLIAVQHNR